MQFLYMSAWHSYPWQVVTGIQNNSTQKSLLRQPKLDLQKCIEICRSDEASETMSTKTEELHEVSFNKDLGNINVNSVVMTGATTQSKTTSAFIVVERTSRAETTVQHGVKHAKRMERNPTSGRSVVSKTLKQAHVFTNWRLISPAMAFRMW